MKEVLREFRVPGVLWILVLTGLGVFIAFTYPQIAYVVPLILGAVSYLINALMPPDSRVRELVELIKSVTDVDAARDLTPEERAQALAAQQQAEELVKRNKAGKILWG